MQLYTVYAMFHGTVRYNNVMVFDHGHLCKLESGICLVALATFSPILRRLPSVQNIGVVL